MSYSWGAARNLPIVDSPRALVLDVRESDPDPGDLHRVAVQMAPMVELWKRLIDEHTPNRSGRCSKCTRGGTGVSATPWPCVVYGIAEMARRRHGGEPG